MFKGTISSGGEVEIPVKRLKGLLEDRSSGKIRLEVIAEDTYFIPWESTFEVETSKKVTVEVKSQGSRKVLESKSQVEILSQKPTVSEKQHVLNLVKLLIKEDITMDNLVIKRNKLNNIVATYVNENTIEPAQKSPVINKVLKVLEKRK
jgi:CRISPR/Cas system-associated exonuclease Cas4 (RecB family)